jgi:hypothetical protein
MGLHQNMTLLDSRSAHSQCENEKPIKMRVRRPEPHRMGKKSKMKT